MTKTVILAIALFSFLTAASVSAQQKVAFTWDDLPVHGPLPPGETRQQVINDLIRAMKSEGMPAPFGFVNAKSVEAEPELMKVLDAWRAAGFPLGNHTWSHLNLNAPSTDLSAWEAEVLQNEAILKRKMVGVDYHWLRFPNLSEGNTPEKKDGARRFLRDHGYKIAGVTMSFADYAYNEPYARCMANGDGKSVELLQETYLEEAARNLDYAHQMSMALFGRDIPYILLMHVGALDAKLLPQLLELYRKRGVKFISLQEAVQDPFYQNDLDLKLSPIPDTLEEAMSLKGLTLPKRQALRADLTTICAVHPASKN